MSYVSASRSWRVELEGIRFGVVHETGPAKGREARCSAQFPEPDVLVLGTATFRGTSKRQPVRGC